jgi:hypothetical protein
MALVRARLKKQRCTIHRQKKIVKADYLVVAQRLPLPQAVTVKLWITGLQNIECIIQVNTWKKFRQLCHLPPAEFENEASPAISLSWRLPSLCCCSHSVAERNSQPLWWILPTPVPSSVDDFLCAARDAEISAKKQDGQSSHGPQRDPDVICNCKSSPIGAVAHIP